MMYKVFAAVTLVAAPIIVLVAQSLTPQPDVQPAAAMHQAAAPVLPSPVAAAPAPAPAPATAPAPEPAAFGQPAPQAGQPFLAPGQGLPDAVPADARPGPEEYVARISD